VTVLPRIIGWALSVKIRDAASSLDAPTPPRTRSDDSMELNAFVSSAATSSARSASRRSS